MNGLLFCSFDFLVFFLAVFVLYWLTPWRRGRVLLLLVASFAFYASWSRWLACIVVASATLDYLLARAVEASGSPRWRRVLLGLSIAANLGLLAYFKYVNFFLDSLNLALRSSGFQGSITTLNILVPLGISFYTFEAISYIVDVYTGKVRAERDLSAFLLFILFFPHLLLGPIVRARDFLPQVARRKRLSLLAIQAGAQLFLLGAVKKLAVADRMAICADPVFADPSAYSTGANWLALVAWAVQVWADFSGYSDMAAGCARLLGYRLPRNFDLPYLATNLGEFWRRWHISLSSWLRDYVYIPLGGSRGGEWQAARNLTITMTLCGLWHGAGWTYILFGAAQGVLLGGGRVWQRWAKGRPRLAAALRSRGGRVACWLLTMVVLLLTYVIFRAPTLAAAGAMYARLFVPSGGAPAPLPVVGVLLTFGAVAIGYGLAATGIWGRLTRRMPAPLLGATYAAALTLALLLAPGAHAPFVYFQF